MCIYVYVYIYIYSIYVYDFFLDLDMYYSYFTRRLVGTAKLFRTSFVTPPATYAKTTAMQLRGSREPSHWSSDARHSGQPLR